MKKKVRVIFFFEDREDQEFRGGQQLKTKNKTKTRFLN